jgi:hypothetical protein
VTGSQFTTASLSTDGARGDSVRTNLLWPAILSRPMRLPPMRKDLRRVTQLLRHYRGSRIRSAGIKSAARSTGRWVMLTSRSGRACVACGAEQASRRRGSRHPETRCKIRRARVQGGRPLTGGDPHVRRARRARWRVKAFEKWAILAMRAGTNVRSRSTSYKRCLKTYDDIVKAGERRAVTCRNGPNQNRYLSSGKSA